MKEFFEPSKVIRLMTSEEIMEQLQEVYRKYFSQSKLLRIRFTQTILTDVTDELEQARIIEETHNRHTNRHQHR